VLINTCIFLLAFLLIGLGFYVSFQRDRCKQAAGGGNDFASPLMKAVRAHGNSAEFIPLIIILLYLLREQTGLLLTIAAIGVTACRYLLVVGLLSSPSLEKVTKPRMIGGLGTYLFSFALLFIWLSTWI